MPHFAHITNGIVDKVIVIDQNMLDTGAWGNPTEWVQTSYNAEKGQYKLANRLAGTTKDVDARNRKNYAGIGYTYNVEEDAFVPPKGKPSFVYDKTTGTWIPPIAQPVDEYVYDWDEENLRWNNSNILKADLPPK